MKIKKWLLGITGGIAAYKTPELVRLLKKEGAEVRAVLSKGGQAFVTPLTLQAVSGSPVYSDLLDTDFEAAMGHIELARWADGILIAPISANRLAALALGMADDLLTTLCLASTAPIWIAPAMNQKMWAHPAVQANLATVRQRGINILEPAWGEQACGEIGWGRMMEPAAIVQQLGLDEIPSNLPGLKNLRMLITAGPTREAIDPVRYLSNRSSGKMGFALAQAAQQAGANVTLISGPVNLPTPSGVQRVDVISAQEMYDAVMQRQAAADIFISAAAVADYRVQSVAAEKIKKNASSWQLSLIPNPDILAAVADQSPRPFCVGFAAETQNSEYYGKKKLQEKNLDLIAINNVNESECGFDVETNALLVMSHDTSTPIPKMSKYDVALQLLHIISERYYAKNTTKNS